MFQRAVLLGGASWGRWPEKGNARDSLADGAPAMLLERATWRMLGARHHGLTMRMSDGRDDKPTTFEVGAFQEFIEGRLSLRSRCRFALQACFDPLRLVLVYLPGPLGFKLRQMYYRLVMASLGRNVLFGTNVFVSGAANISIGEFTWIDNDVRLEAGIGRITIGNRVHVGSGATLQGGGSLIVEDYVGIGYGAKIFSRSETPAEGKRMVPMVPEMQKAFFESPVVLKKDAFLGPNVVILPGVTIGEGAVVGANAFVNRDIPAWAIAAGIPAKVIGERDKVAVPDLPLASTARHG